jgi:hypothetical protein
MLTVVNYLEVAVGDGVRDLPNSGIAGVVLWVGITTVTNQLCVI